MILQLFIKNKNLKNFNQKVKYQIIMINYLIFYCYILKDISKEYGNLLKISIH